MSVQKRQAHLLNEAKALAFFFGVSSERLLSSLKVFDDLYADSKQVNADELHSALNVIDLEIERLCINNSITDDQLEDCMDNNFAFKSVVL